MLRSLELDNSSRPATQESGPPFLPTEPARAEISPPALQSEVARILAGDYPLRQALHACTEALVRHTGVALARVWVSFGCVLKLQASAGIVIHEEDSRASVPVGQFSIGHIVRTRLPMHTNSILDQPHIHDKEWSRREGMTAFAGYPLLVDNELVGVIAMFDNKPILPSTIEAMALTARDLALAVQRKRGDDTPAPSGTIDLGMRGDHAIIVTTPDGVIAEWNRGAERSFGYPRHEAVGQPLAIVVPQDRADDHYDIMQRVACGEQVARAETTRQHKSGHPLDVRLTVTPLRDAAGVVGGAITVVHDLADVKKLHQQYCAAQKMEVFGQLAGGVAHDFNNLLTVILGYSEIVQSRLQAKDPLRDLLNEIQKAGERASTLTRQLLAYSRKKVIEPKVLDLNAVVADTEKMLRRLIGEDILMTTIFASLLKPIQVDPGQLQQVILNLAVNARDAMPDGGRLTIETANVSLDDAYAQAHPDVAPGNYVLFGMSDTGVGMNAAVQARIFEPLFTTKAPGKGTGLGLTTVQTIVKQYGGHIEVFSEVGRGSTFNIYLPQVFDAAPQSKSNAQLRTIPRGHETILLVEDENSVRALTRHVLELNGYKILEATNGEEAIRLAQSHPDPIHLLLTDVVMPHLGGRPLADHLLTLRPTLKVLFLSGYTNDAIVRQGVVDSDFAFLQKPFSTSALAQKVRDVLDQPHS